MDDRRGRAARSAGRWAFGVLFVIAGVGHFLSPEPFIKIVPRFLPYPRALVLISGGFEIALGVCLQIPATRRAAALGLIALLIAVFPANLTMYQHASDFPGIPPIALLIRLPLQALLIWWAYQYAKGPRLAIGPAGS